MVRFSSENSTSGLNETQKKAYEAILGDANVFLTGGAGTGKSYVVSRAIEELRGLNRKVLVCAPTGLAAQGIGGVTIHKGFEFPVGPFVADRLSFDTVSKSVSDADVVVIDEVSMVRRDMMEAIAGAVKCANAKRAVFGKPNLRLVVLGDFFQLPPVLTGNERDVLVQEYGAGAVDGGMFAFQADGWKASGFERYVLSEPMRQSDEEFVCMLNKLRIGDPSCLPYFNKFVNRDALVTGDTVYLAGRNDEVDEMNIRCLGQLDGEEVVSTARLYSGYYQQRPQVPRELHLKVGAKVVLCANSTDGEGYANGTMGVIANLDSWDSPLDPHILVELQNGSIAKVRKKTWEIEDYSMDCRNGLRPVLEKHSRKWFEQFPIKLGWAMTVHKCQGQTLDSAIISPSCFAPGQLYVALSRVRSPQGLVLTRELNEEDILCSEEVKKYYQIVTGEFSTTTDNSLVRSDEIVVEARYGRRFRAMKGLASLIGSHFLYSVANGNNKIKFLFDGETGGSVYECDLSAFENWTFGRAPLVLAATGETLSKSDREEWLDPLVQQYIECEPLPLCA